MREKVLRVLGEGALIVASILLAFAIDTWWDESRDEEEEVEILTSLLEEFALNQVVIQEAVHRNGQEVEDLAWLVGRLGPAGTDLPPDTLEWALSWILASPTLDPMEGAIRGLISSGRLERIQNEELRVELAGWPSLVEDVRENELAVRELVAGELVPALARKGVFLGTVMAPGVPWPREDDDGVWADDLPPILSDPEIRNLISYRYHWAAVTTGEYRTAEEAAQSIVELLQAELASRDEERVDPRSSTLETRTR